MSSCLYQGAKNLKKNCFTFFHEATGLISNMAEVTKTLSNWGLTQTNCKQPSAWYISNCVAILIEQKMKFSIKNFFSKCDQIRSKLHFLCSDCKEAHCSLKKWAFINYWPVYHFLHSQAFLILAVGGMLFLVKYAKNNIPFI